MTVCYSVVRMISAFAERFGYLVVSLSRSRTLPP